MLTFIQYATFYFSDTYYLELSFILTEHEMYTMLYNFIRILLKNNTHLSNCYILNFILAFPKHITIILLLKKIKERTLPVFLLKKFLSQVCKRKKNEVLNFLKKITPFNR